MYHPAIITQRLTKATATLGFEPVYHSVAQVTQAINHFDSLLDDETGELDKARRPNGLTEDEERWVRNERKLCQCDFKYFATRYAWVINEIKQPVLFHFRIPQQMNLTVWAEHERFGWPIEAIQLKARQLGLSTLTEIAIAHRVFFWPYSHALIASSDESKSYEMSQMLEFVYEHLPWWLAPERTKYQAGNLMEFKSINTRLTIQHGTKKSGLGRGSTPNIAHLSELPDYENPEEIVDASLMNAIHANPLGFLVLESTAKGYGNWWYDSWKLAREGWPRGRSRLHPIFLPWYTGTDIKPTPTWLKMHEHLLANWDPQPATLRHKERAERYVHNESPLLESLLGKDWMLPRQQMLWWEITREEHLKKNILHKFLEENPGDELEAFQSPNSSCFTIEDMERISTGVREPRHVYQITGSNIPSKFHPDPRELNSRRRTLHVTARWNPRYPLTYAFNPIVWRGYENEGDGWQGKLLVWELPVAGESYSIGVDTSYGMGQDRSVIQVIRKGSLYRYDEQVAEYADPSVSALDLWPYCMAVATWYSQGASQGTRFLRQCRLAIEVNALGLSTQFECKKRGWHNFHPWLHPDRKKLRPNQAVVEGWYTNVKSRHQMMVKSIRAARVGSLLINSRYLVEEMQKLQKEEDDAYISSVSGHDDRWMALGFGYYSAHQLDVEQDEKQTLPGPDEFYAQLPTYAAHHAATAPVLPPLGARVGYDQWIAKMTGIGHSR